MGLHMSTTNASLVSLVISQEATDVFGVRQDAKDQCLLDLRSSLVQDLFEEGQDDDE